jgi:hypothetical protein
MKTLIAAAIALGLAWVATSADAYIVEVTTTVAVADADDQAQLREALQEAVDSVLKDAIAFKPTLVVLTRAMVVGGRLYVRLLIADQDGERTVEELGSGQDEGGSASPETTNELKI